MNERGGANESIVAETALTCIRYHYDYDIHFLTPDWVN